MKSSGVSFTRSHCPPQTLLLADHKHLKSTNLLERLNEELKRWTLVVRIFPNTASCLRLTRALAVEMHEDWIEATRYLNVDLLRDQQEERGPSARPPAFCRTVVTQLVFGE